MLRFRYVSTGDEQEEVESEEDEDAEEEDDDEDDTKANGDKGKLMIPTPKSALAKPMQR